MPSNLLPCSSSTVSYGKPGCLSVLGRHANHTANKQQMCMFSSMWDCCLHWLSPLQASVNKGSISLADNGARLAGRLAQLHADITCQSELVQMFAEQQLLNAEADAYGHELIGVESALQHGQDVLLQPKSASADSQHVQHPEHFASGRQTQSRSQPVPQNMASAGAVVEQGQAVQGRDLRPLTGSQSRHDVHSRGHDQKGRSEPRQGRHGLKASPLKGRQRAAQDTRYTTKIPAHLLPHLH